MNAVFIRAIPVALNESVRVVLLFWEGFVHQFAKNLSSVSPKGG
jgi:hypothetical protein